MLCVEEKASLIFKSLAHAQLNNYITQGIRKVPSKTSARHLYLFSYEKNTHTHARTRLTVRKKLRPYSSHGTATFLVFFKVANPH